MIREVRGFADLQEDDFSGMFLDNRGVFSNFSFKVSEDKVYDTIEFNEFLQVTITRRGLPSLFLFSNVKKLVCIFVR